jgi:hypothetical protein
VPEQPLQAEQVTILAAMCGGPMPDSYLRLIADYPETLRSARRAEDGSSAEGFVSDVELLSDLADVLLLNEEARCGSILDPDGQIFSWPDQLLIIGENGTGDYFGIDISGEHAGVLQYLHQPVEFEQISESLDEYIEMLLETFCPEDEFPHGDN